MARLTRPASALAAGVLVCACGQRGPLYLPDEAPTQVPRTTPEQSTTQQGTTQPASDPSQGRPAEAADPSADDAPAEQRRKSETPPEPEPR